MTWARIDDAILDNPKIMRVGPIGFALHVAAISWCARNLTDGFIPEQKAKHLLDVCFNGKDEGERHRVWTLSATSGMAGIEGAEVVDLVVEILVEACLWEPDMDDRGVHGYRIHDYADYNPTRAEVLKDRERKSAAGRIGGANSAAGRQARAQADAQAGAKQMLKQTASKPEAPAQAESKPDPVPDPVPIREDKEPPIGGKKVAPAEPDAPPPAKVAARVRKKPRIDLPAEFGPSEQHQAKARELGVDCQREFEKFKAYVEANGKQYSSWNAGFTTWLLNANEFKRNGSRGNPVNEPLSLPQQAEVDRILRRVGR